MEQKSVSPFARQVSKGRLEFLFDGIFAIAMTILVLELKVPELQNRLSANELGAALLNHGRTFFSYILSFFVLSMFWFSHNRIYTNLKKISNTCLAIHIWLLAVAAFFPFCAHLLGKFPGNRLTLQIYFGTVFAYFLGILLLIITAEKQKLFDPEVEAKDIRKVRNGFLRSCVIILVAFIFYSFFSFGK
ncbi:MAG: TMEM175 family protein [Chrysiogenales bacterium]